MKRMLTCVRESVVGRLRERSLMVDDNDELDKDETVDLKLELSFKVGGSSELIREISRGHGEEWVECGL